MAQPIPTGNVQSVERAVDLLELMCDAGGEMGLTELAATSGMPLPTIHRLLRTLVGRGYVRQLPSRRYALGPRLIRLGDSAGRQFGSWARPQLSRLVDQIGETANVAMLDGDMAVYVAQVPSPHAMRMFTEIGRRVYTHCTGVGKAILAQLPASDVQDIVRRRGLPAQTTRTITDLGALVAELDLIRERGYAEDDGEQELGVHCFAVAVPGAPSPTAISVSGPEARVTSALAERIVPLLQQAARALGEDLEQEATTA